mmetsp:Transcript_7039/g.17459  ORF Transcript_7039/g.17459 Transcript_7039/m.17459 type:complete len:253 (+) Transcript_7039:1371-2129(+)
MRRKMSGRGWWMDMTTVTPAAAAPAMMSTTRAALVESSPVVGSSSSSTPGRVSSSTPMDTRRFSPPLSPRTNASPMNACATRDRPSCSATTRTRSWMVSRGVPWGMRRDAWKVRYSHTVEVPGRMASCCTYPVARLSSSGPTSAPSSLTSPPTPLMPSLRPDRMSSSVVLPAPEGPRMANRQEPPVVPLPLLLRVPAAASGAPCACACGAAPSSLKDSSWGSVLVGRVVPAGWCACAPPSVGAATPLTPCST